MSAPVVRSTLRRLFRAKNAAFKGDDQLLRAGSNTIRSQFESNKHATPAETVELLKEAEDAISFLQQNVVQSSLNSKGNYHMDNVKID